jgi:threonine/homoserine/homoserine lactone efflux protein
VAVVHEILTYLAVAILVIVTPGPDTAVTVRSALLGGRRAGMWTAAGVATGQLCWTLAASAGVTALLLASEPVFVTVKIAGAVYLGYLGVQALIYACRGRRASHRDRGGAIAASGAGGRAYRQGLMSDLGNPKMAAFFTSLLPQFAPGPHPAFFTMLALGTIFCLLTLLWLVLYSAAIDRAAMFLHRPTVRRWIEGITGTVLVALGVRLATQARPA